MDIALCGREAVGLGGGTYDEGVDAGDVGCELGAGGGVFRGGGGAVEGDGCEGWRGRVVSGVWKGWRGWGYVLMLAARGTTS